MFCGQTFRVKVLWSWILNINVHKKLGSSEIWTRIDGFKVQSANHYTREHHFMQIKWVA